MYLEDGAPIYGKERKNRYLVSTKQALQIRVHPILDPNPLRSAGDDGVEGIPSITTYIDSVPAKSTSSGQVTGYESVYNTI